MFSSLRMLRTARMTSMRCPMSSSTSTSILGLDGGAPCRRMLSRFPGNDCQISSVRNGMNGCPRVRIVSKARRRTALWFCRTSGSASGDRTA
jgi:hypothetical protein